jgi:hypothetical protein
MVGVLFECALRPARRRLSCTLAAGAIIGPQRAAAGFPRPRSGVPRASRLPPRYPEGARARCPAEGRPRRLGVAVAGAGLPEDGGWRARAWGAHLPRGRGGPPDGAR